MATVDEIREAIREVYDPEIGINIVDLGLVYGIEAEDGHAHVTMTLTSPACPIGPYITAQVQTIVNELEGIESTDVELVWRPPWDPRQMASEEAKLELGIW